MARKGPAPTFSPVALKEPSTKTRYRRTAIGSAGIVALALATSGHLWGVYKVPSDSMSPTIAAGSTIVAISWGGPASVGDVVTFTGPGGAVMVKRVAASGGDVLACCDARGQVTRNSVGVAEPYTLPVGTGAFGPLQAGPGQLLVLGDHRADSQDSRTWGPVAVGAVRAKVVAVLWPPSAAGLVR